MRNAAWPARCCVAPPLIHSCRRCEPDTDTRPICLTLRVIVNCAGLLHGGAAQLVPEKRLADVRPEAMATSFAVHAMGPLLVARHFERLLARRERAVCASLSARVGSIGDNRLGGWYA